MCVCLFDLKEKIILVNCPLGNNLSYISEHLVLADRASRVLQGGEGLVQSTGPSEWQGSQGSVLATSRHHPGAFKNTASVRENDFISLGYS